MALPGIPASGAQGFGALARAKINLFLHVTGRRPDGYHTLDSLAVFAEGGDRLSLAALEHAPDGTVTLDIEGPFGAGLNGDAHDNLVLRAARALQQAAGERSFAPVALTLDKRLPVASGIGGGSADAAAALRLLARAWGTTCDLAPIAATLGADVPVCLEQIPARMGGIGEILDPAPALPACAMLLVNCGAAVPTPAVFKARAASGAGFRPAADLPGGWADLAAMVADLARTSNDLQDAAIALCPPIRDVLNLLNGTRNVAFARMSGSGATCFALYPTLGDAEAAGVFVTEKYPWWTSAGVIGHASPVAAGG